jgi:hypothetical protein
VKFVAKSVCTAVKAFLFALEKSAADIINAYGDIP